MEKPFSPQARANFPLRPGAAIFPLFASGLSARNAILSGLALLSLAMPAALAHTVAVPLGQTLTKPSTSNSTAKSKSTAAFGRDTEAQMRPGIVTDLTASAQESEAPKYSTQWAIYRLGNGTGFRTIGTILRTLGTMDRAGTHEATTVELHLVTENQTVVTRITIAGASTPFDVITDEAPRRVVVVAGAKRLKDPNALERPEAPSGQRLKAHPGNQL